MTNDIASVLFREKNYSRYYHPNSFIYFIGNEAAIKIGYTKKLQERLSCIQTGNHLETKVLGFINGGKLVERHIHAMFRHRHLRGEWYENCEEIHNFIKKQVNAFQVQELTKDKKAIEFEKGNSNSLGLLTDLASYNDSPFSISDYLLREELNQTDNLFCDCSLLNFRRKAIELGLTDAKIFGVERISIAGKMSSILLNKAAVDQLSEIENREIASDYIRNILITPSLIFSS